MSINRLSLNTATAKNLDLPTALAAAAEHGYEAVGLWRDRVAETGVERTAQLVKQAGLRVSSLCRGGFMTASEPDAIAWALSDNKAAIDEAAGLGTSELVMVVGGLPAASAFGGPAIPDGDRDLGAARQRVIDRVGDLVGYAQSRGVRLALEPMHPIFTADRGVLATLGEALDIAEDFPAEQVGVVVDSFHVWWDPQLEAQVARAGASGRIASFQVCDWITPLPADTLLSRGMMGDGHIDFRHHLELVSAAGYTGDIEVEIFNADVWAADPDEVLETMKQRYLDCVVPAPAAEPVAVG